MKPHKHAELIKAWADGAEIEWRIRTANYVTNWNSAKTPAWDEETEYRIKPEPNPKEKPLVKELTLSKSELLSIWHRAVDRAIKEDEGEAHEFFAEAILKRAQEQ